MRIESMPEKMPEAVKSIPREVGAAEFERFVTEGIEGVSAEMARRSVGPATDIDRDLLTKDTALALSQVPVDDPNLRFTERELANPSDEIRSLAMPLALAKARVVEKQFHLIPKERKPLTTFRSRVRKAALGLSAFSLVASACTSVARPTISPTPFNTEPVATEVSPTPTALPTPEILATATETFTPFTPPVNPPEFTPGGAGGEFPEGVREQAEIDRYRALLVLARQEGRIIFGATDEEVKQQLNAFAEETNTEVKQEWNGKFGDEYQMVSVNIRTNQGGSHAVFWFATPGGALSARPDIPSEENSKLVGIDIPADYHPEFRWGEDENIYMFRINDKTGISDRWWDSTAPATYNAEFGGSWKLTQNKINELANGLVCPGTCVNEGRLGGEYHISVDVVASGAVERIELYDKQNEIIGRADVLVAITKAPDGTPTTLYIVIQLFDTEHPDINLTAGTINYLAENYQDMENPTPYTLAELEKIVWEGRLLDFGYLPTTYYTGLDESEIVLKVYEDENYVNSLLDFFKSRGATVDDKPIIIFPNSIGI